MSSAEVPQFISVEEYLAAEEMAETRHEYVDGWVRGMSGGTVRHNMVKSNCLIHLGRLLHGQSCRPFDSDMKLRIRQGTQYRFYYPDIQVVCDSTAQSALYQDWPVLIIEVLSPSTRLYDLDEKMQAYLAIPTLQYYLILEQHQPQAIVLRRSSDGFLRQSIEGVQAEINLPFLGCALMMSDIYDGVEFTPFCVQESEVEYETNV